jgi:uncharacterized protein (TIGR02453 family)
VVASQYFTPQTMSFLRTLARHNQRDWFEQNKPVYEVSVRTPALQFITEMADDLAHLSPYFLAQAKKVGGSLMRVHRDVRFSKDKQPYKTNIGIQFRHERGKDVHAPGFYVHIEPAACFVGVGVWHPDAVALGKIRDGIAEQGNQWQAAICSKSFQKHFVLGGESLNRPPRGYAKEHPLIDDLKRKDFIAISTLDDELVLSSRLRKHVLDRFKAADDFMRFLCQALQLQY